MRILFFDTSCDFILVGLFTISNENITENYFYSENHPREASYRLLNDIDLGLKAANWEKPDAIVCCKGPGSFTGIRIAVTTARNLSQIWKIPTFGIDTLEMYSMFYSQFYGSPVITAIDGKQKKVFAGYSNGRLYKGTYDVLPQDLYILFREELKEQNVTVISDTELVSHSRSLLECFPNPIQLFKNKLTIIQNLTLPDNAYSTLLPNYMRETYAHKL